MTAVNYRAMWIAGTAFLVMSGVVTGMLFWLSEDALYESRTELSYAMHRTVLNRALVIATGDAQKYQRLPKFYWDHEAAICDVPVLLKAREAAHGGQAHIPCVPVSVYVSRRDLIPTACSELDAWRCVSVFAHPYLLESEDAFGKLVDGFKHPCRYLPPHQELQAAADTLENEIAANATKDPEAKYVLENVRTQLQARSYFDCDKTRKSKPRVLVFDDQNIEGLMVPDPIPTTSK